MSLSAIIVITISFFAFVQINNVEARRDSCQKNIATREATIGILDRQKEQAVVVSEKAATVAVRQYFDVSIDDIEDDIEHLEEITDVTCSDEHPYVAL